MRFLSVLFCFPLLLHAEEPDLIVHHGKIVTVDQAFTVHPAMAVKGARIQALGYRVLWTPEAELYHFESKTRGYEDTPEKLARFRREYRLFVAKWGHYLHNGDPYYNPNFRLDRADYALRA